MMNKAPFTGDMLMETDENQESTDQSLITEQNI